MTTGRGDRNTRRITAPVPLSTTNPTWPDLAWNQGRSGGKSATNRLSYGTANNVNSLLIVICFNIIPSLHLGYCHWINVPENTIEKMAVYDYLSIEQAVQDILGKCGVDRRILLKWILRDIWSESVDWFKRFIIGFRTGLLWTGNTTFAFHKRRRNPWPAKQVSSYKEIRSFMKLIKSFSGNNLYHYITQPKSTRTEPGALRDSCLSTRLS
jgi:hypothetical protein